MRTHLILGSNTSPDLTALYPLRSQLLTAKVYEIPYHPRYILGEPPGVSYCHHSNEGGGIPSPSPLTQDLRTQSPIAQTDPQRKPTP